MKWTRNCCSFSEIIWGILLQKLWKFYLNSLGFCFLICTVVLSWYCLPSLVWWRIDEVISGKLPRNAPSRPSTHDRCFINKYDYYYYITRRTRNLAHDDSSGPFSGEIPVLSLKELNVEPLHHICRALKIGFNCYLIWCHWSLQRWPLLISFLPLTD